MASDGEDFDDLEALRQAALASVKSRANTEAHQQEDHVSSVNADEDEDLFALREAALRSTKVHSVSVTKDKPAVDSTRHRHERHSKHLSYRRHPYNSAQKNANWRKNYSRSRANNHIVIPLTQKSGNFKRGNYKQPKSQEPDTNLESSDNKNLLLPQYKWARIQPSVSENISSAVDRNSKKRKDGKFSRYDDSESDEDSLSDSDSLSLSSEPNNQDMCSDTEHSISNKSDTRIVKHDESKEIIIKKSISENSELEVTGESLEMQDKISSDSLLEDFEEPLLEIQENGEIDDTSMNVSDKQLSVEGFTLDIIPSPSKSFETEESGSAVKEVLEARKKKFESTGEIKGSNLNKTISLKGIIPKSKKRHRQQHRSDHQRNKSAHSNHQEELHSRDLKERNYEEVEDLRIKTSRSKDYHHYPKKSSGGSPRSSDDSCYGGSFSDGAGHTVWSKDQPHDLATSISTDYRYNQPISQFGENQRRVVQERSPPQNSSKHNKYHLSDASDSGEDNENNLLKKRSLSSIVHTSPNHKRHKSRSILDSDQHSNGQKERYPNDSKVIRSSHPRGWAALIESRSQTQLKTKKDIDYHMNCDTLQLEEQIEESPQINFTFQHDEVNPVKKVDDRLPVHHRLGFISKSKLESSEKSTEKYPKKNRENRKNKSSDPSKETELDQKILRIQEMNAAILKRQAEVKKDKERYG